MTKRKFQLFDKVRVIAKDRTSYGMVGVVSYVPSSSVEIYLFTEKVRVEFSDGTTNFFYTLELERINEA